MRFRRVQLGLAIAATFAAPMAHALGLGPITVRSGLNEPLRAEIPLLEVSAEELPGIETRLASSADFARVGLSAGNVPVPLEFAVITGAGGTPAIAVTSREPVREPLVSVLIEVNWANGRLLREYNILLDPPRVAPAIIAPAPAPAAPRPAATTAAAAPEPAAAPAESVPASGASPAAPKPAPASAARPAPARAPAAPTQPAPAPAAPAPAAAASPAAAAAPAPAPRPDRVTVQEGDTLWEIAQANRPRPSVTIDQMMIALQRENPQAFIGGNINRIRRGATLSIPEAAKVDAISPAAARADVQAQVAALAAQPAAPAAAASAAPAGAPGGARVRTEESRLEVLPARSGGDGSGAAGERAGTAGGTDARRVAQLDADLKRAQEQVASRDQEVRELRSRVTDLEKIDRDRQSLVALKDSDLATLKKQLQERDAELARLAARVKELEAAKESAAPASEGAAPAPAPAAEPAPAVAAEEKPAADAAAIADTAAEPNAAAAGEGPAVPEETTVAADPAAGAPAATAADSPSVESSFEQTAPRTPAVAEPVDTAAAPVAEAAPAEPAPVATPWWQQPIVLAIAAGAALLLLLAGIFGRRRKAAAAAATAVSARGSVAEAFQDSDDAESEEGRLLGYLATAPNDLDAHLELLRVYAGQRDFERFETAANAMYAQVYDPGAPQWQEALALGRDLLPDHPLFAEVGFLDSPSQDGFVESGDRVEEWESLDSTSDLAAQTPPPAVSAEPAAAMVDSSEPTFEMEPQGGKAWDAADDIKPSSAETKSYESVKSSEVSLDMDFDLEPFTPAVPDQTVSSPFAEDTIGTKLDLARAYIDMGDIDGARSMLQEVEVEGAEVQRQEARRLLDSLG